MDLNALTQRLRAFDSDPIAALNRLPEKRGADGRVIKPATPFSDATLAGQRFVALRDTQRKGFSTVVDGAIVRLGDVLPGRAPIAMDDRVEDLADNVKYRRLSEIDAAGLRSATLAESPWSSDYWAIYLGLLGKRYADQNFPKSFHWEENLKYVRDNPARDIAKSGDAARIDLLAPSEKYDLVVGDADGTLTKSMWATGQSYHDANGEVETWMGICHGWSPAAYMMQRPVHAVDVVTPENLKIRFYPDDIKALASLLWANGRPVTRFIGGRCNDKEPAKDENGRIISQRCFDTNPGSWHLALANQLGVSRRSMVMDATYDYQVWNQPLYSYESTYFNPKTMAPAANLQAATVALADHTRDRFKKYRGQNTKWLVGVSTSVRYVAETMPTHSDRDSASRDALVEVSYDYDLELDADGKIIGGEWYVNAHPDFLWTPPPGARARSPADAYTTGEWGGTVPVPASWRQAAPHASASSVPLARFVETLIRFAND